MEGTKLYALLVVALIIGLAIGYPVGYYTAPAKEIVKEVPKEVVKEVKVHPLSGQTIYLGLIGASVAGMEWEEPVAKKAIEDVNNYIKMMGLDVKFDIYIECAEGSAPKALQLIQDLHARGVKFVVGLRWSSHCKSVLEYANEHKIICVSDGSTSPLLSIPDDFLFRLPTDDRFQGRAIAKMLESYGIKYLAILQRGDTWGKGLYEALKENFEALGGEIIFYIEYDPEKTEFSAEIEQMAAAVRDAIDKYGAEHVAVEVIGFGEIRTMVATASDYPELMSIMWFGNDGYVRDTILLEEQGPAALMTRHPSTYVGPTESAAYNAFAEWFQRTVGYVPGAYQCYLYDSIWIIAKAILEAGTTDTEVVRKVLPKVAESYFGVSGWCRLNEAGDRAMADYNIWGIVTKQEAEQWNLKTLGEWYNATINGQFIEFTWALVGVYRAVTDTVEWYVPIPMPKPLSS
ncbi:MAG: hypothetical protein DRJ21_02315 [Candidatus Methanomethylicota archaeon]|uniref:Receptor ligand binding region domain-containing protein n=1 Tax=Thermoproteota archaeon TaxID=2056631 RepID=A0A497EQ89_9CREN|nr:MAG: hypothetical protein DRJ21_02315 [Candidatus Verstraetearchaeota archaeon]